MANFSVEGMQGLVSAFNSVSNVPEDVKVNCLTEMAQVAKGCEAASAVAYGLVDTHKLIDSLSIKKPTISVDGGMTFVTFKGTRIDKKHKKTDKPTRNAEIAFINEYGCNEKGIPAKPFISDAIKKNEEKIIEAGQKVINQWLEQKF